MRKVSNYHNILRQNWTYSILGVYLCENTVTHTARSTVEQLWFGDRNRVVKQMMRWGIPYSIYRDQALDRICIQISIGGFAASTGDEVVPRDLLPPH